MGLPTLRPDFIVRTVFDINIDALRERGIHVIAFDIENTLGLIGCDTLDDETEGFLIGLHQSGLRICFATNSGRDFSSMIKPFHGKVVQPKNGLRKKPHPDFFRRILEVMDSKPEETAMVGDKLEYDTSPANSLGMTTVLVTPLGKDLFLELVVGRRRRERRKMRRLGISRPTRL